MKQGAGMKRVKGDRLIDGPTDRSTDRYAIISARALGWTRTNTGFRSDASQNSARACGCGNEVRRCAVSLERPRPFNLLSTGAELTGHRKTKDLGREGLGPNRRQPLLEIPPARDGHRQSKHRVKRERHKAVVTYTHITDKGQERNQGERNGLVSFSASTEQASYLFAAPTAPYIEGFRAYFIE